MLWEQIPRVAIWINLCLGVATQRSWARTFRKPHKGVWREHHIWHTACWRNPASKTACLPAYWPLSPKSRTFAKLWHKEAPILAGMGLWILKMC